MRYKFMCNCEEEPIEKIIDTPVGEIYTPACPSCSKPMKRVYGAYMNISNLKKR